MYNDMELSKYLYVVADGFDRSVIGDRTNTTVKVGHAVGETFLDTTKGMRKITMPFYINKDIPDALEKIAQIVNVEEPKQLIFGDEPDWYYSAIIDGMLSFTRLEREGSGTITWLVPDMYKHAVNSTTYSNNGADKSQILFTNNSNASTPVTVRATFPSDNGFIGLVLNGNSYQIGVPQEVDGIYLNKSETLVKGDPMPDISAGVLNKPNFKVMPDMTTYTQTGSFKKESNGQFTGNYGTGSKGHGPSLTFKLPNDSEGHFGAKNYMFRWHSTFGSHYMDYSSVGQICATLHDKNGNALAQIVYSDLSQQKVEFNVKYIINNKEYFNGIVAKNTIDFTGHAYIQKINDKFIFRDSANPAKTFNVPEMLNTEACYVSFAVMQWGAVKLPTFISLVNWNFTKDFINEFKDTPNYFKAGDQLTLNSAYNELSINGYNDWDRTDIGSKPLIANVGENILGIVKSDWADMPLVSVVLDERKL